MKITHTTLISAALSMATALGAVPAAGAKPREPAAADLATQRVTTDRQYVVVKPDGKTTHPISVTVSIRNIGHAAAPASETEVRLVSNGHQIANETIPLARLAPGHASTQIARFPDAEPQLGFVHATVIADSTVKVSGPTSNDVKRSPDRPVIAQRWTGSMESEVQTPGLIQKWTETDDATTGTDVVFRFSALDGLHRFAYTVGGTVKQTAAFTGQGCTGEGETSPSMARWGKDSGLYLSQDLTEYEAVIRGSLGPPFTVDVTCPDVPTPTTVRIGMKDLLTEPSIGALRRPMNPAARVLSDMGTLGSIITITNSWHLVADVP